MHKVRCKLRVTQVTQFSDPKGTGQVNLSAIYETKPGIEGNSCTENHVFGKWTPCAEFKMTVLNPDAFSVFKDALEREVPFYVDFTQAVESNQKEGAES